MEISMSFKIYTAKDVAEKTGLSETAIKDVLKSHVIDGVTKMRGRTGAYLIPEQAISEIVKNIQPKPKRRKTQIYYPALKRLRRVYADRIKAGEYDNIDEAVRPEVATRLFEAEILEKMFPEYLDK